MFLLGESPGSSGNYELQVSTYESMQKCTLLLTHRHTHTCLKKHEHVADIYLECIDTRMPKHIYTYADACMFIDAHAMVNFSLVMHMYHKRLRMQSDQIDCLPLF